MLSRYAAVLSALCALCAPAAAQTPASDVNDLIYFLPLVPQAAQHSRKLPASSAFSHKPCRSRQVLCEAILLPAAVLSAAHRHANIEK